MSTHPNNPLSTINSASLTFQFALALTSIYSSPFLRGQSMLSALTSRSLVGLSILAPTTMMGGRGWPERRLASANAV
jgi:4-hydroxybenzoate polyprenyltransferase